MVGPLLRSLCSSTRRSLSSSSLFKSSLLLQRIPGLNNRHFSAAAAPASSASSAAPGRSFDPTRLRNVAVIAHDDHGKTTLMDRLCRQCGADITHERALDNISSLERERGGITISSKATSSPCGEHEGVIWSLDWRSLGAITPIRNQGDFNTCWAFVGSQLSKHYISFGPGFHARGRGQRGRFDYAGDDDFETPYYEFPERKSFGGRGGRRDYGPYGEEFASQAATSSRPDLGWHRRGAVERGRGRSVQSKRQPFSPEGHYSRPFGGRQFIDDPYTYNDSGHGIKRPYSMMDHEPGYLEPSRLRPRFDYSDPVVSSSGSRYQGSFGASSGLYSHDYYGSDYGGSSYSSMYGGGDRSYGGGYYY